MKRLRFLAECRVFFHMAVLYVTSHAHLASPVISLSVHVPHSPVATEALKILNTLSLTQETKTEEPVKSDILRPVFSNPFSASYYGRGSGILRI